MRSGAAQLMADPNFEIGSHGLRHLDMSRLNGKALRDEIVLTEAAYSPRAQRPGRKTVRGPCAGREAGA